MNEIYITALGKVSKRCYGIIMNAGEFYTTVDISNCLDYVLFL